MLRLFLSYVVRLQLLLALLFLGIVGCGTPYESTALKSWDLMSQGRSKEAVPLYEKNVTSSKEKLLRLMDEGILLRVAGLWKESNETFFAAAKWIEQNDYLSLSEQATTLLTNEKQQTYQGEDFEKVLIHVYLALNFMELKAWDSALVEARRVNEILYQMISKAKRPYELNAFARYMGAHLFEKEGQWNDALIDYENTLQIAPHLRTFPALPVDLFRASKKMSFSQKRDEFRKQYGEGPLKLSLETFQKKQGAILLFFECGKSPQKYSSREYHAKEDKGGTLVEVVLPVPYYKKRDYSIYSARLEVNEQEVETFVFNNIEGTAIKHLQDRMKRAVAKALATAVVNTGIAAGIAKLTDNADLGILSGILLTLGSEADTRSWLLLPANFQVAKVFLPPGTYDAKISYLSRAKMVLKTEEIKGLVIEPNEYTFLQRRSFE